MSSSKLGLILKDSCKNKNMALKIKLLSGDEYIILSRHARLINDDVYLNYEIKEDSKPTITITEGYYSEYYMNRKTSFMTIRNMLDTISRRCSVNKHRIFEELVRYAYKNNKIFWRDLESTMVEYLDNGIISISNIYSDKLENLGTIYVDDNKIVSVTCIDDKVDKLIDAEYNGIIEMINQQKIA